MSNDVLDNYRYDSKILMIPPFSQNGLGIFLVEFLHAITEYKYFSQPPTYPPKGVNTKPY